MAKSTEAEVEQRIQEIYLLLLRRENRQTICRYARSKWGVSDDQADRYTKAARELMRQEATAEREDAIAEHIALRKDLFNKAYKDQKWAIAFQIAGDECKLRGLYFTLEDHVRMAIAAGYKVVAPGSPEDLAISAELDAGLDCEVEIGIATPPIEITETPL